MMQKEVEKDGSSTVIGRLFDVSKENPQFTAENIFAETAAILIGVMLQRKLILCSCFDHFMNFRRQTHRLQHLHSLL